MLKKRTRTRGSIDPWVWSYGYTRCNGLDPYESEPSDMEVGNGELETTIDVVVPQYAKRSAQGEIFNNPFSKTKVSEMINVAPWSCFNDCALASPTAAAERHGTGIYGLSNPYGHDTKTRYGPHQAELDSLKATISTRALAGVAGPEVQGLVDIAEFRKTVRLIKDPVTSLTNYLKQIKRSKKYRKAKSRAKAQARKRDDNSFRDFSVSKFISDNWLKYRYGIMPLVYTASGLTEVLSKPPKPLRRTSRSSGNTTTYYDQVRDDPAGTGYWDSFVNIDAQISSSVRAGVLYEHRTELVNELGLNLQAIPSTAWELIPFSFVVDWFANVGDYIEAVTPKAGVSVLAEWSSVKTIDRIQGSVYGVWAGLSTYTGGSYSDTNFQRTTETLVREPGLTASLVSKIPQITFEKSMDWTHLKDAIALFVSISKSK